MGQRRARTRSPHRQPLRRPRGGARIEAEQDEEDVEEHNLGALFYAQERAQQPEHECGCGHAAEEEEEGN